MLVNHSVYMTFLLVPLDSVINLIKTNFVSTASDFYRIFIFEGFSTGFFPNTDTFVLDTYFGYFNCLYLPIYCN